MARLRIVMHALRLAEGPHRHLGGNYYHVLNLARAINARSVVDLVLLADEDTAPALRRGLNGPTIFDVKLKHANVLSADRAVQRACRELKPDVYHRPTGQLPFLKLPCKTVATIADLNFRTLRMPWHKRLYKELSYRWTLRVADRVTCVSEFTRQEVVKLLKGVPSKLCVIHHGANLLRDDHAETAVPSGRYWLCFGHQAHKNVEICLEALKRRIGSGHAERLVIIGQSRHLDDIVRPLAVRMGLGAHVDFVGRVEESRLRALYSAALGLLFMSRFEGFGLPVLEAMGADCPVISSDACSLPEVVGDAGILVSPDDLIGLERAMDLLVSSPTTRIALIRSGQRRIADFSWEKAACETISLYQSVVSTRNA